METRLWKQEAGAISVSGDASYVESEVSDCNRHRKFCIGKECLCQYCSFMRDEMDAIFIFCRGEDCSVGESTSPMATL